MMALPHLRIALLFLLAVDLAKLSAAGCSANGTDCSKTGCCKDGSLTCFLKDHSYGLCMKDCKQGIHKEDPEEFRTAWSCSHISKVHDGNSTVVEAFGQCGGKLAGRDDSYAGPTQCAEGCSCHKENAWYSACRPKLEGYKTCSKSFAAGQVRDGKVIYNAVGRGACRGTSASHNPSSWYTANSEFNGNLEDCQDLCTLSSTCKAVEFVAFESVGRCELWTREPQYTGGSTDFACMTKTHEHKHKADLHDDGEPLTAHEDEHDKDNYESHKVSDEAGEFLTAHEAMSDVDVDAAAGMRFGVICSVLPFMGLAVVGAATVAWKRFGSGHNRIVRLNVVDGDSDAPLHGDEDVSAPI